MQDVMQSYFSAMLSTEPPKTQVVMPSIDVGVRKGFELLQLRRVMRSHERPIAALELLHLAHALPDGRLRGSVMQKSYQLWSEVD